MHLQQFLRRIEHRAYADVRGPVEYPPVGKAAAHRINAIGRARIVAQTHIGGGKADGAAQLVAMADLALDREGPRQKPGGGRNRSEEHTSELQSLMRISYAVFSLKKKKKS